METYTQSLLKVKGVHHSEGTILLYHFWTTGYQVGLPDVCDITARAPCWQFKWPQLGFPLLIFSFTSELHPPRSDQWNGTCMCIPLVERLRDFFCVERLRD